MPDKKKTLAQKFQEVAERSRKVGNVATGKTHIKVEGQAKPKPEDSEAYRTRPGRGMAHKLTLHPDGRLVNEPNKDVNLPIDVRPKKKK